MTNEEFPGPRGDQIFCPVCAAVATLFNVVDFNKSCDEARGTFLPSAGIPVRYFLCSKCGFCFAPEIYRWSMQEFSNRIYNDDYKFVDPDYLELRPRTNAQMLKNVFASRVLDIRHLDYGGGNGLLSSELFGAGWDSTSYDPFVDGPLPPNLGRFNLVTCFEVFEHVPDVNELISRLYALAKVDGIVLFSTFLSDGNLKNSAQPDWWYAAPRNGHISLFSSRSLALLGRKVGFEFRSFSPNLHAFWRSFPAWAAGALGLA